MNCTLCPLSCGADRKKSVGACGVGGIKIAKYYLHPFEEPPISHKNGSGCVFFCGCSMKCVFCQNFVVSRGLVGKSFSVKELADIFRELEDMGADNINLVTGTHYANEICEALDIYRPNIPIVYNTHSYEKLETLKMLDKYIDIYLPDFKFIDPFLSKRYTGKANYAEYALPAIQFMAKKPITFDSYGKMLTGVIVRHLIMPMAVYDSLAIIDEIAKLGDVYFSLMSQYTPYGEIEKFKELGRKITSREYNAVLNKVQAVGLKNVFLQDRLSSSEKYIPIWDL